MLFQGLKDLLIREGANVPVETYERTLRPLDPYAEQQFLGKLVNALELTGRRMGSAMTRPPTPSDAAATLLSSAVSCATIHSAAFGRSQKAFSVVE